MCPYPHYRVAWPRVRHGHQHLRPRWAKEHGIEGRGGGQWWWCARVVRVPIFIREEERIKELVSWPLTPLMSLQEIVIFEMSQKWLYTIYMQTLYKIPKRMSLCFWTYGMKDEAPLDNPFIGEPRCGQPAKLGGRPARPCGQKLSNLSLRYCGWDIEEYSRRERRKKRGKVAHRP
jgi:hypothetical protein